MKPICVTAQIFSTPAWRAIINGRYEVVPATGCWEWTGPLDRYGYGRALAVIGGRKRRTGAHRASWIAHRGPILGDLQLDHLCRNRKCVNPFHLEPVTSAENTRRGFRDYAVSDRPNWGRPKGRKGAGGCKKHSFMNGRIRVDKKGYEHWDCQICAKERARRWYDARRSA